MEDELKKQMEETAQRLRDAAVEAAAVSLYDAYANEQIAAGVLMPTWRNLYPAQQDAWRDKARQKGVGA